MYYSSGNYEAFARPKKPEGVDNKSAYIVGSGLAALTAACYLVRDGQMKGEHIHILEKGSLPGGACDGIEELVGKGGTLEFFAALYRHDYDYKLNLLNAFFKEIRIVGGVFQSPYAFPRSIALVNTLDLDPILEMDCVFTPEAFEDAFEAQMNGRTIKSLVQFTPDVE